MAAPRKRTTMTKKQAVAEMFAAAPGERFPLVVQRDGNARQREMLVDGTIRLNWRSTGESVPIELPAGTYRLQGVIIGNAGQTWSFAVISPKDQPLRAGTLTALGADSFSAQVTIP